MNCPVCDREVERVIYADRAKRGPLEGVFCFYKSTLYVHAEANP